MDIIVFKDRFKLEHESIFTVEVFETVLFCGQWDVCGKQY